MTETDRERTIWFHRAFRGLTGGEVKHSHYFAHVGRMPGFAPRIVFTGGPLNDDLTTQRRHLWPVGNIDDPARWKPSADDLLFLAGTDWRFLSTINVDLTHYPCINLVQHVRHAKPDTELWGYLPRRAIRICVSAEVADAIAHTGRPRGPIIAIPNATDLPPWDWSDPSAHSDWAMRPRRVAVVGYKRPELAAAVSTCLTQRSIAHDVFGEFCERSAFLDLLAESQVVVCLPNPSEGFYLPALEAMASGCVVVTLDALGNRSFCRDGENCILARPDHENLAHQVAHALWLSNPDREGLLARAAQTVVEHALHVERSRFHAVLGDVDRLWADTKRTLVAVPPAETDDATDMSASSGMPPLDAPYRPRLAFMIVGAQKCGTTALAQFLSMHPEIGMSSVKEVHLFDAPEYAHDWTPVDIDNRYRSHFIHHRFTGMVGEPVLGEATPVYMFFPDIPAELARYNPNLRLIVLLRDPVERAVSHYHMEEARGSERWPLWLALLLEPFRLLRSGDPRHPESVQRLQSYRSRGLYSRQLRNLYRAFDPDRVLVLWREDLLRRHDAVLSRVFAFLGVSQEVRVRPAIVFEGEPDRPQHRFVSWFLRLSYLAEFVRLRRLLDTPGNRRPDLRPKASRGGSRIAGSSTCV